MSDYVYLPPLSALPTYLGGPAAMPQPAPAPTTGSPVLAGDTWGPTVASYGAPAPALAPVPPVTSLQPQGLLSSIDQLLTGLGSLTHRGERLVSNFCQSVADFFSHQPSPGQPQSPAPSPKGPTQFVLSSFNVLSTPAGRGKGYAPGPARMHDVAAILRAHHVSVVGFQEMEQDQLAEFRKVAGKEYGTFAGESGMRGYHDTTLAWRKDTWDLLKASTITVPSYEGRASKVPYVLLRNKQTGQEAYFIDAHNPANTQRHHHQEGYRDAAAGQEAALAKQLREQTGRPVFVVGDMNSVTEAQDIFTSQAPLKAAASQKNRGIDWIFGTKDVRFDGFQRERGGLIARTTDHPVAFTDVTIGK